MGVLDNIWRKPKLPTVKNPVAVVSPYATPMEMMFRFTGDNQVVWYADGGSNLIKKGFLENHVIYTIQDWKCSKVASVPPVLYRVKNAKAYKKYRALLQNPTDESLIQARIEKYKALEEIENSEIMNVINQPNPLMGWYQFAYGYTLYKDQVGAAYFMAVRSGSVNDKTKGKIKQMFLPPAHHMRIISGGQFQPIKEYYLQTSPSEKIEAANVCRIANFSPQYENETQHLYGLSRLQAAKNILLKYDEGTTVEANLLQKRGIRDILFRKTPDTGNPVDSVNQQGTFEQFMETRDVWEQRLEETTSGGIMVSESELGSIRVGMSIGDLKILESQKVTKEDLCAAWHIHPMVVGYQGQTTYTNFPEARKMAITDAVIPELEALKDALNNWFLPSYGEGYVIDFDLDFFSELQEDKKAKAEWLDKIPLSPNEYRTAMGWDEDPGINSNKIMVRTGKVILDDIGIESYPSETEVDPDLVDLP
ncbi:phage portal protein [Dyadobacter sp. CY351]|uniref:phage portal protein n=1 Tax=Dyadobacter sp. CY351 TaxID=2909337 RepID=UPI001F1D2B03|nr:phage portal protein [Dyadobacter sp. CY351]MCF2517137.1 phage portal protein [Dyadobacter sp. CY351]